MTSLVIVFNSQGILDGRDQGIHRTGFKQNLGHSFTQDLGNPIDIDMAGQEDHRG